MREIVLDVSELEAPAPLIEASRALERLGEDEVLVFKHRINPRHLFNEITARGMRYEILKNTQNDFLMKIWREDVSRT